MIFRGAVVGLALGCFACGGPEFFAALAVSDGPTASEGAAPVPERDAGALPEAAAPIEASVARDAAAPDVLPDVAPDVADAGSDTTFTPWPADGSTCTPLFNLWKCTRETNVTNATATLSYCVFSHDASHDGLSTPATPAACNCAETYSCACVTAAMNGVCFGDPTNFIASCDETQGGPLVVCGR